MKSITRKSKLSNNIQTLTLMIFLFFPALHAESFSIEGPGGGGAMYNATISPHDINEVLVSCDMTGAYISHDGGHSWRMFNLRGVVHFFAFDPLSAGTIYAGTQNLWRSTDDGASWKLVWPRPSTVRGVQMNSDHVDESIISNHNPLGQVVALAIDPADSHALVAGTVVVARDVPHLSDDSAQKTLIAGSAVPAGVAQKRNPAVFLSQNDGAAWEKAHDLPGAPLKIWIDPRSDKKDRDLYIAEAGGVTVRSHGKWQNRPAPAGVEFTDVSGGFSGTPGMTLYATSKAGIFLSKDGGSSWIRSPLPGSGSQVDAIATSLRHPEFAYASYRQLQLDGKTWMGVARTQDGGRTWSLVWKEDKTSAPNIHDAWISKQIGVDWSGNPLGLGVAEQNPKLCYATDLGRTMLTTDEGENWNAVYSKKVRGGNWTSTGLDVTTSYGYMFDPFDANRRFVPTTDIGLSRSEDQGRSWTRSVAGVPEEWSNTTYWVAFDPAVRGKMWGVMSGTHDLPRPKMWQHKSVTSYKGGVCLSVDGGRTWKPSNTGMDETAPTHIILDPSSKPGKRTLWVAAMGRGVYRSTDDGATWTLKNRGIVQNEPLAWRLARAEDGTLYVVIARRSSNGSIGTSSDGAVYKSTNGADSWTSVKLPEGANGPNGVEVDPQDPNRLYLAAWARADGMHGVGGGIFLSVDGGASWKNVLDRDQHIYDVTIDPRNPSTLYATGFESSAWLSTDRGEHWSRIPGFNFKWAHRVMPDLENPKMIFISTFGGGVWHGPFAGGKRRGDIATPELEPWR